MAQVCAVHELNVSAVILHERAFFFPTTDASASSRTVQMLRRLEASREMTRMLSAADGGVGNINGDDVMFGFNALDAILGEICVQLSARAEKALRDSEALVTEVLRNPNLMDDAATERMREGVQQGNFFVQREKVLAEAVEEMLKTVLEVDIHAIMVVLAHENEPSDVCELEAVLESHLHELGIICAQLELAELHIEHGHSALLHREHR